MIVVNIYEAGPFEGRLEQWPVLAVSGALEVRLAETEHEIEQAQRLRYTVFYEEMSAIPSPKMREERRDFDKYDDVCDHLLVVDRDAHDEDGQPLVVGTYRLTREHDAKRAGGFYTSSEYNLAPMLNGPQAGTKYLELGRSCVLKSYRSRPGTMQLLWKGLLAYVARFDIDLMFGCASLPGTDVTEMALPLSYLHHHHPMPRRVQPSDSEEEETQHLSVIRKSRRTTNGSQTQDSTQINGAPNSEEEAEESPKGRKRARANTGGDSHQVMDGTDGSSRPGILVRDADG